MNMLAGQGSVREKEARLDILGLEHRVLLQDGLCFFPSSKHSQDVLNRDSHIANYGFPAKHIGAYGNSV